MSVTSLRSNADQDAVSAEIKAAKVAILNVALWTMAWTPYAAIPMGSSWGDNAGITPFVRLQPHHLRVIAPEMPRGTAIFTRFHCYITSIYSHSVHTNQ